MEGLALADTRHRFRVTNIDGKPSFVTTTPTVLGHFRDKLQEYHNGVLVDVGWGNPYGVQTYVNDYESLRTVEHTWDEIHPITHHAKSKRDKNRDSRWYEVGGPFLNQSYVTGLPDKGVLESGVYYNTTGTRRYEGGFCLPPNSYWSGWANGLFGYGGVNNTLLPNVAAYFDRAWRSAKPKLEMASLYVFLREIKETYPMIETSAKAFGLAWKDNVRKTVSTDFGNVVLHGSSLSSRNMGVRDLADQFLNQQFGWAPFLGDLKNFFLTWLDAKTIIKKLTDDNGRWTRRRVKVQKDEEVSVVQEVQLPVNYTSYSIPCFPTNMPADFFTGPPSWKITDHYDLSIHASGKFRFYRPEFDVTLPDYSSAWNKVMRYVKIYGLEVSPYHVWQATPWTWLSDWVFNLGAYIERMSDTYEDQVAAAYFYITAHMHKRQVFEIKLPLAEGLKTLTFERSFSSKQRVSADSPYGFQLTWDNLSPKRLAILAALGITRKSYATH
jgi:hypothetical protein